MTINDEKIIKEFLKILDNISTYKKGNLVYLSDGSTFNLPEISSSVLDSNSKSYR